MFIQTYKILFILLLIPSEILFSQWYQQAIPVNRSIREIEFIDVNRGWAITMLQNDQDTSYLIRTTNGGVNWAVQYKLHRIEMEVLEVVDSLYIYIGGYNFDISLPGNTLIKSTNGGINFTISNPNTTLGYDDMIFTSRDTGYICENTISINLWKTTDGGISWVRKQIGLVQTPERLFFLNSQTGYCGAMDWLQKTTNGGDTWTELFRFTHRVLSIFFLNENLGWVGLANNRISKTNNGGLNFTPQEVPVFYSSNVYELYFINENTGWGGSRIIRILKTTTGGDVWGYQIDSGGSETISIIDSLNGWSATSKIYHTTNGGGTITQIKYIASEVPSGYKLHQNYPNPFNSMTTIDFELPTYSQAKLLIYDISGREITRWQSDRVLTSGRYSFRFDAGKLSSGTYFYKLEVSGNSGDRRYNQTRKMVLVK